MADKKEITFCRTCSTRLDKKARQKVSSGLCRVCYNKLKGNENAKKLTRNFFNEKYAEKGNLHRYAMFRAFVGRFARRKYLESSRPKFCIICGYDKHFEVCHVKSVEKFSDTTSVFEICDLYNLIALCPNHHWEFDNGLISIGVN